MSTWSDIGLIFWNAIGPKLKTTPLAFEKVDAPTAEEGSEIPVLFGTRELSAPNIVWYGDVKTKAIKKKGGKK